MSADTNFNDELREYLEQHEVEKKLNHTLNISLRQLPTDPFAAISQMLKLQAPSLKGILGVEARPIRDGRGRASIEVTVTTRNGPSRASVSTMFFVPRVTPSPPASKEDDAERKMKEAMEADISGKESADKNEVDGEAEGEDGRGERDKKKDNEKSLEEQVAAVRLSTRDYFQALQEVLENVAAFVESNNVAGIILKQDPTDQQQIDSLLKRAFRKREQADAKEQMKLDKEAKAKKKADEREGIEETPKMRWTELDNELRKNLRVVALRAASLATSQAICRAGARENKTTLYRHLADIAERAENKFFLPVPVFCLLNGGDTQGAEKCKMPFRAIHTVPAGAKTFSEAVQFGKLMDECVQKLARERLPRTEDGGFSADFLIALVSKEEESGGGGGGVGTGNPLGGGEGGGDVDNDSTLIKEAVEFIGSCLAATQLTGRVYIGISVSATTFFHLPKIDTSEADAERAKKRLLAGLDPVDDSADNTNEDLGRMPLYDIGYKCTESREENHLEAEDLVELMRNIISRQPICFLDDPFVDEGLPFWKQLQNHEAKGGTGRVQVVANKLAKSGSTDAFVRAQKSGCFGGAILDIVNTCGTVTDSIDLCQKCQRGGTSVIIADGIGGTCDTFLADFAVALKVSQFRIGSVGSSLLSRLQYIEAELGQKKSTFIGKKFRNP
eukprot:g3091.t1